MLGACNELGEKPHDVLQQGTVCHLLPGRPSILSNNIFRETCDSYESCDTCDTWESCGVKMDSFRENDTLWQGE
jgi:hypothetical protein